MILRHMSHFLVKKKEKDNLILFITSEKKNQDYFIKIAETVRTTLNFQLTC